jgi:hypothetical protein
MAFTATQLPIEGTLPSLGGAIEWLNTQPLNMKPRCTGKSYSSSFGLIPASTGGAPFLTSAHGRTNTRIEIGPDLGPIIAGKNAAQSSPSLSHPSTPPGSCCPVRYAVGDGCNPSATLRSCSWHLRSILPVANVCFRHPMICYGISRALRFADLADRRS